MIKLKDILKELDVGDELFADDNEMFKDPYDDLFGKGFRDKLSRFLRINNIDKEINTEDETKILFAISRFVDNSTTSNKNNLMKHFNTLLSLKSKYPEVLDPKSSSSYSDNTQIYRGMRLPITDVLDTIENEYPEVVGKYKDHVRKVKEEVKKLGIVKGKELFQFKMRTDLMTRMRQERLDIMDELGSLKITWGASNVTEGLPYNKEVTSRALPPLSFTTNKSKAKSFAAGAIGGSGGVGTEVLRANNTPVVVAAKLSDLDSKLLFNPDFLNTMRTENEIMYGSNKFMADSIYLIDFHNYFSWDVFLP